MQLILSILGCIAWILAFAAVWYSSHAYIAYAKRADPVDPNKKKKNNIVSWFIMTFITVMNAGSYFGTNQDWAMAILPMTGSIACFIVFCYMLFKGVFERPTDEDLYILLLGVVAIFVWEFKDAKFAHFVTMATFSIAVLPILRDVLADPANEDPTPWSLWCRAFTLGVLVVIIRSHHLAFDLIYPGCCLIGHTSLTFITKRAHAKALLLESKDAANGGQAAKELENSKTKTVNNL